MDFYHRHNICRQIAVFVLWRQKNVNFRVLHTWTNCLFLFWKKWIYLIFCRWFRANVVMIKPKKVNTTWNITICYVAINSLLYETLLEKSSIFVLSSMRWICWREKKNQQGNLQNCTEYEKKAIINFYHIAMRYLKN